MLSQSPVGQLVKRCTDPIEAYRKYGDTIDTPDGPMTYIDNGGDTLAVVHLDCVLWRKPKYDQKAHRIVCPQLDDRLGLWSILDMLPKLGVKSDVLLTDSEEIGRSTARFFRPPKQYNWMYQFDRRGTDSVLYTYDSEDNRQRLIECGLECTEGSFSDICLLEHLECSGWNIGTAYHGEHTPQCYANLHETEANIQLFAEFWRQHHTTHIPIPESRYAAWDSPTTPLDWDIWECKCGNEVAIELDTCTECGRDWIESDDQWERGETYKW